MNVPPTLAPGLLLRRASRALEGIASRGEPLFPFLRITLRHADIPLRPVEFLAAVLVSGLFFLVVVGVVGIVGAALLGFTSPFLVGIGLGLLFGVLVVLQNLFLPRALINRKVRSLERNLMPALVDLVVQISAGSPLFDTMVHIGNGDYGAVSAEFRRAVRRISTGENQVVVLEELATSNPSVYFRRVLWQLVNALKTGAPIGAVMTDAFDRLSEEQLVQIQSYGGQLNGLTMFYMLTAVIAPALLLGGTVVASFFFGLTPFWTIIVFAVIYLGVLFLQVMFLGLLRTRRPNLL